MSRATSASPIVIDILVTLTVVVRPEPDVGGYSASIPALSGCHSEGETLDEVLANLREAAEGWLAVAHEDARDAAAKPSSAASCATRNCSTTIIAPPPLAA
jgi:predicted RNase H-like HicB family nuclease